MSAEMTNLVKFVFYYGHGNVRTNDFGADLGEFMCTQLDLTAPQTWSVSQLKEWLTGCLGYNIETYTVSVQALWTKSRKNIFWTLRHVDTDRDWFKWLKGCEDRHVNPRALVLPVLKEIDGGHVSRHSADSSYGMSLCPVLEAMVMNRGRAVR